MLAQLKSAVGEEQAQAILEGKKNVVASCGSGMTAGVVWLGLSLLGVRNVGLYDEVLFFFLSNPAEFWAHLFSVELDWVRDAS
jgi:hypothetical protein